MRVCLAAKRLARTNSRPGIFNDEGNEAFGSVELEAIALHRDGELCNRLGRSLALAHDESLEDAKELVAIGGEVLEDIDDTALVAEDGYEIDSCHLRAEKLFSCRKSADLVGRAKVGSI